MISYSRKFIFVHVPKTGGSAIEATLFPNLKPCVRRLYGGCNDKQRERYGIGLLQHLTADHIREEVGEDIFKSFFKFAVVRNPWDKLVSEYAYISNTSREKYIIKRLGLSTAGVSFSEFAEAVCKSNFVNTHLFTQSLMVGDSLDFIGKFENLQEDFNIVCDKIGIPRQELTHINKSQHKHYTEYYDDETREIVAEKYSKDIECFGYEFGE